MKSPEKSLPSNLEIPYLRGAFGLGEATPGLMVFDSAIYSVEKIWDRPFRSSHYSIILVQHGQMQIKVNLQLHSLNQGDLLIVPPSAIREMSWQENSVHFLSLLFAPDFILTSGHYTKSVAQLPLFGDDQQALIVLKTEDRIIIGQMIDLIHQLLIRFKGAQKGEEEILRPTFQATISQIGFCYQEQQMLNPPTKSIVQQFFDLLVKHYKQQREVSFYARSLNIHEKYLSQVLKENTGHTARSYIIQMVILEAKVLLDYPGTTIGNIADELNFQNQFHFSRFFKKYTQLTPSEYRNGHDSFLVFDII
jgi:AraC-like DNA-binding protein